MVELDRNPPIHKRAGSQTEIASQAARSFKWSFLYNFTPRLVTPLSTVILAALLTPADFGLVAISTLVIAFARILVELGLAKTVVQRENSIDQAASASLWLSLFISLFLYLLLWLLAPPIALAYGNSRATDVIRVAALALPLTASMSIPSALLQRGMAFRSLFWVNTSFLVGQAITSVVLALAGYGYWALIVGQLFGYIISSMLAWKLVRWIPSTKVDWAVLRSVVRFSLWVMLSSLQNWLSLYADNAIAGIFLGIQGLGIYSLGFNVATVIPGFLIAALGDVAYPAFCRLQRNPSDIGRSVLTVHMLAGMVLFPLSLGVSAIAPTLVKLLYADKWDGLGTVISLLVIMPGLSYMWSLNEKAYLAVGRPDISTKLSLVSATMLLPLLWLAAPYGLLIFTLIRFLAAGLLPLGHILFGMRTLGIGIKPQVKSLAFCLEISCVMYGIVSLLLRIAGGFDGITGWIKLAILVMIGAAVYLALLWRGNRQLWDFAILNVRRILA